jgi:hypothetical protein
MSFLTNSPWILTPPVPYLAIKLDFPFTSLGETFHINYKKDPSIQEKQ